jgi:hypothetical protein
MHMQQKTKIVLMRFLTLLQTLKHAEYVKIIGKDSVIFMDGMLDLKNILK